MHTEEESVTLTQ